MNRVHPEKTNTIVLDFVNDADDIEEAFSRYYEASILSQGADPNLLYDLQRSLLDREVFDEGEMKAFAEVFFDPKGTQDRLYACLAEPQERFGSLPVEDKSQFRKDLASFTRMYSFLSQVAMPLSPQSTDIMRPGSSATILAAKTPGASESRPPMAKRPPTHG